MSTSTIGSTSNGVNDAKSNNDDVCSNNEDSKQTVWSFGFGSNMNRKNLELLKQIRVLDEKVGILKGHKLAFNVAGFDLVEPAFAGIKEGSPEDQVHGVAFRLSKADFEKLMKMEISYEGIEKKIVCYDGELIHAFVLFNKPGTLEATAPPSRRYVQVIVKGAVDAGIDDAYVERLRQTPTYEPTPETLCRRNLIPAPETLPIIEWETIKDEKFVSPEVPFRASVMGFVFEIKHRFSGLGVGNDWAEMIARWSSGEKVLMEPSTTLLMPRKILTEDQQEFIMRFFDHILSKGRILGYLKEFLDAGVDVSWVLRRRCATPHEATNETESK